MQLRVGTVIALRAPMWDNHGEGSLKVVEKGMAFEVGVAADFGTCAGVKRDGARCSMVVNTAVCRMCDWHLKQAASKVRVASWLHSCQQLPPRVRVGACMVVHTAVCRMCDWHLMQAASNVQGT